MNDCKSSTTESRPEFAAILDNFKDELAKLDENSGVIMEKACQLRDFREPQPDCCEKQGSRGGVIGELEECVRRMADYNYRLNDVRKGLVRFVG